MRGRPDEQQFLFDIHSTITPLTANLSGYECLLTKLHRKTKTKLRGWESDFFVVSDVFCLLKISVFESIDVKSSRILGG